jgi:hypothetical protein
MCPLCLTSLAVTVTTTTGVGAAALAVATRVAKSLTRHPADDPPGPAPADRTQERRGER